MAGILRAATILAFPDFRDWPVRLLEDEVSSSRARAASPPSSTPGLRAARARGISARDLRALVRTREELTMLAHHVALLSASAVLERLSQCCATAYSSDVPP
ncbi:hypothetical protein FB451DRAFT_1410417 [Mycena latifolia]|nr:hypothetical protein FB451DRAFT_1410417 [Mycena latifolia]